MADNYYVYALFRENSVPFYIGMGHGNRWLNHERWAVRGQTSHKDNIICKMRSAGIEVPKVKLEENLTKAQAVDLEIHLISILGREPNGPLTNLTKGGDGICDLPEEKRRLIGEKTRLRQLGSK